MNFVKTLKVPWVAGQNLLPRVVTFEPGTTGTRGTRPTPSYNDDTVLDIMCYNVDTV